jgi:hypothetical protein
MKPSFCACLTAVLGCIAAVAGPPFQTDDPEPIEYQNYEFYTFGTVDGFHGETDSQGPAFEFNWGALPNTHLHIIVPAAGYVPEPGNPAFGLGDIELGIKYRFIQETKTIPQIGTFVMFEIPTGDAAKGLGVGRTWYKIPLWAQKSYGPWTTYGGGGEVIAHGNGYRNYSYGGWLLQRDLGKKFTLAGETFYHGLELAGARYSTLVDLGGYYKFHGDESYQLLFCYGHSASGQTETYAYLGLYWTWGKKKPDDDKDKAATGTLFDRFGQGALGSN